MLTGLQVNFRLVFLSVPNPQLGCQAINSRFYIATPINKATWFRNSLWACVQTHTAATGFLQTSLLKASLSFPGRDYLASILPALDTLCQNATKSLELRTVMSKMSSGPVSPGTAWKLVPAMASTILLPHWERDGFHANGTWDPGDLFSWVSVFGLC